MRHRLNGRRGRAGIGQRAIASRAVAGSPQAVQFCVGVNIWAISGNLLRGVVPQAEQARAAALQVVLIGVLIALMLVLRPRGLIGEKIGLSRPAKK